MVPEIVKDFLLLINLAGYYLLNFSFVFGKRNQQDRKQEILQKNTESCSYEPIQIFHDLLRCFQSQ